MSDDATIRISIVSACRNERAHIGPFLASLNAQDMSGLKWEAIIADGLSSDGTREILEAYAADHPEIRIIANPGRIVSTGLNAAIRAARGDVVLRMDAHTRYAPDYCLRCVEALERTGADNVGGPARTDATGKTGRAIAAAYHSRFSTGGARFHDVTYRGWVDTVPYGCWRKQTLLLLGLFDETLVRNQDDEMNLRLIRAGGKIWQDPVIVSTYSPRHCLSGLFGQYFQYGFWKIAVIRKHRLPASWRHLIPGLFVAANAAALIVALAGWGTGAEWLAYAITAWFLVIAAYAVANLVASLSAAIQHGFDLLPYLPIVFAVYHCSYGAGFLTGLLRFGCSPGGEAPRESVFSRITR